MAIKTRIQLRNDQLSNWTGSQKTLLNGEVALARLSGELSDKYEVRIGVGNKTWDQLSGSNFMIPAENVVGLENNLTSLQVKFYQEDSLEKLPIDETVTNGSIGVVLETVTVAETDPEYAKLSADGKQLSTEFRTAYWFDTSLTSETNPNGTWRQMDGNYKADNVYFTDNMKLTYAFGKHTVPTTGSYTLSCKNMSLTDVLKEAYAETKAPSVTQPTFSFTTTASLTGEVGTNYTVPAATFKMTNDGNYEYGPTPTGVKVLSGKVTISCDSECGIATKTSDADIAENGTLVTASGTSNAKTYSSTKATYNYKAVYSYTDGSVPVNNIGGAAAAQ